MFQAAKQRAVDAATKASDQHYAKVRAQLVSCPPPRGVELSLEELLFDVLRGKKLPMSNLGVRRAAADALIDAILSHYPRIRDQKGLRHFLLTATWTLGMTFDTSPVLRLKAMQQKVRNTLARRGLEGVCAFEFDLLARRLPGEASRRILVHIHGIVFTLDPSFQPITTSDKLSRTYLNDLDVPGITFTSRAQSSTHWSGFCRERPEEDQTEGSMAWLAYYLLKAPHVAKNRYQGEDGRQRMRPSSSELPNYAALRLAELWSHLTPASAVFGVGPAGCRIRTEYINAVQRWASRPGPYGAVEQSQFKAPTNLNDLWQAYWLCAGKAAYGPVTLS